MVFKIKESPDNYLLVIIYVPVDPVNVLPHFGVDSWVESVCTADAPGNDALKETVADEWTTGVSLWSHREKMSQTFFMSLHIKCLQQLKHCLFWRRFSQLNWWHSEYYQGEHLHFVIKCLCSCWMDTTDDPEYRHWSYLLPGLPKPFHAMSPLNH